MAQMVGYWDDSDDFDPPNCCGSCIWDIMTVCDCA